MKSKYPILIPIKGNSVRCPNKNKILLPYTIAYLQKINRLREAIVITDSSDLVEYAKSLGANTYFEIRVDDQDELLSCYNFLKKAEIKINYFFLMPVTHPFRTLNLCSLFEEKQEKHLNFDFIVSLNVSTDRSNFFVDIGDDNNPHFLYDKNRKGRDCQQYYMVDGALYLIKQSFLERIIQEANTNYHFWKGNFQYVINEAPFLDIDTVEDMKRFDFLKTSIVSI